MPKFTDLLEDENGSVANMGEQPSPPAAKKNERGFEEDDEAIIGNELTGVMDDLSSALVTAMADVIKGGGGPENADLDDVLPDDDNSGMDGQEGDHDTDNVPTDIYKDDDQTMNDHPSKSEVGDDDEKAYGDTEDDPDAKEGPLNDEPANDEPPFIDDQGHNGKGEEGEGDPDENDIKDDDMKDKDADEELMDDSADDHEDRLSDLEDHVFGKKKKAEEDGPSPYQQDTY